MNNSEQIFAIALGLGLGEPWFIEEILFDQEKSQLDI
jgi:hypothetical protein